VRSNTLFGQHFFSARARRYHPPENASAHVTDAPTLRKNAPVGATEARNERDRLGAAAQEILFALYLAEDKIVALHESRSSPVALPPPVLQEAVCRRVVGTGRNLIIAGSFVRLGGAHRSRAGGRCDRRVARRCEQQSSVAGGGIAAPID